MPDPVAKRCDNMHNASMPVSITIRDVPDDVRDELAARAKLSGQSLQEYVRARLVALTSRPDAATVVARWRAGLAEPDGSSLTAQEIVDAIHEGRR